MKTSGGSNLQIRRRGAVIQKGPLQFFFFARTDGPQFGRKIRGARASPGPATECDNMRYHTLESTSHQGHLDGEQVS